MTTLILEDEMAPVPDWVWLMALAEKHNITAFPEDLEQFVRELIAAEREACARVCEPKSPRPCDCDYCDCGNSGDRAAVVDWDASNALAAAIRARGGHK
jgi:hypothetical protein